MDCLGIAVQILSAAIEELKQLFAADKEVRKLSLPWIQAMLRSAEERQQADEDVRSSLAELKKIVYDADDVVDGFITKSARRQARRQVRLEIAVSGGGTSSHSRPPQVARVAGFSTGPGIGICTEYST